MPGLLFFFLSCLLLVAGYCVYGLLVEKVFGADKNRPTPVFYKEDGVDYVKLPIWKCILIQLLNIAGLGPVFGPIVGALFGPAALLWVVLGCIFGGAVHDYLSGMICVRYKGASYAEIISRNLSPILTKIIGFACIVLLVLVGATFTTGPAALLSQLSGHSILFWGSIIIGYYILATIFPIDTIIARIYPYFAILLLFMAVVLFAAIIIEGNVLPQVEDLSSLFVSTSPKGIPIWPALFIIIACGAISGFHATQSPLIARCMTNEKQGRRIFYGSMIAEGFIALIWVTLGLSFYQSPQELLAVGAPPVVVKDIAYTLLGPAGGVLAVLGVVVLPISTGDTAFRSARLQLSDLFKISQVSIFKRVLLSLPLFAIGITLTFIDFTVLWRYFSWLNQTLAATCLWACSVYLTRRSRFHWVASIPALFMTTLCTCFICQEKIGFGLSIETSTFIGLGVAALCFCCFLCFGRTMPDNEEERNA